jgi:hypothetical protein
MYCKTILKDNSPVVVRESGFWFGYYIIDGTLYRVGLGLGRVIQSIDDGKKRLNKFLAHSSRAWLISFPQSNCKGCKFGGKCFYNPLMESIFCNRCGALRVRQESSGNAVL